MSEKHYGRKSDIWSLGVTLIEMTTGKPPFRTAAAAIYSICVSKELPRLPEHMSPEAHYFLSRCVVENPKSRGTCEELCGTDFIRRPLTSQQSMDLTKSLGTRLNHVSSSVTMNPLSGFVSPPSFHDSGGSTRTSSETDKDIGEAPSFSDL